MAPRSNALGVINAHPGNSRCLSIPENRSDHPAPSTNMQMAPHGAICMLVDSRLNSHSEPVQNRVLTGK